LIAIEVATVASWLTWAVYAPSLVPSAVLRAFTYVVLLATAVFVYSTLLKHYEQTERAVRLPNRRTRTEYGSLPRPVLAVRIVFVLVVAVMLVFGLAPMREATARGGIIATVVALFVLGLLSVLLEGHYLNTGRAKQISVDAERGGQ
jgi:hypothetical protein